MSSSQRKNTKPTKASKKKSAPPSTSIPPADCYVPRPVENPMTGWNIDNWMYQSSSPLESQSQVIPETQFLRNTPRRLEDEISEEETEETEETEDADYWMYKYYEKWRQLDSFDQFVIHLAKKHRVSESPSSEPSVGFNLNFDPPQPMGRDEAKRKKRGKSNATNTTSTNSSIQEDMLALSGNVQTYKEAQQIKESNLKIKEKMQLRNIISQDISNKTGFEYELALQMKKDAARQLGYHIDD